VYKILVKKRELKIVFKTSRSILEDNIKSIIFNDIMNACRSSEIRKSGVGEGAVVNMMISTLSCS
jgi:hypothetical protein